MKQEAPHINIERSIIKDYRKTIWKPFVKGIREYRMIEDGDRVAVCISGGEGLYASGKMPAAAETPERYEI